MHLTEVHILIAFLVLLQATKPIWIIPSTLVQTRYGEISGGVRGTSTSLPSSVILILRLTKQCEIHSLYRVRIRIAVL